MTRRLSARSIRSAVSCVAERIRIPWIAADALRELLVGPVDAEVDVEALAQEVDAGVGDLLLDEEPVLLVRSRSRRGRAPASKNTRCAAPTPRPCSTSWPSCESAISRPESEVRMSNAPK
jgi:hypothetical protein